MQEETLERKGRKEPHNLCCYLPSGLNPEGSGAFALTAPNSTEEDAAAREFLIQQAAEKKVNELAFQLSQTEQMIEDINEVSHPVFLLNAHQEEVIKIIVLKQLGRKRCASLRVSCKREPASSREQGFHLSAHPPPCVLTCSFRPL